MFMGYSRSGKGQARVRRLENSPCGENWRELARIAENFRQGFLGNSRVEFVNSRLFSREFSVCVTHDTKSGLGLFGCGSAFAARSGGARG